MSFPLPSSRKDSRLEFIKPQLTQILVEGISIIGDVSARFSLHFVEKATRTSFVRRDLVLLQRRCRHFSMLSHFAGGPRSGPPAMNLFSMSPTEHGGLGLWSTRKTTRRHNGRGGRNACRWCTTVGCCCQCEGLRERDSVFCLEVARSCARPAREAGFEPLVEVVGTTSVWAAVSYNSNAVSSCSPTLTSPRGAAMSAPRGERSPAALRLLYTVILRSWSSP